MANSTFSGPVRSQNGFQELVDGVWVPVGGGGGGGVTLIPYTSGTTTYTVTGLTSPGDSASFCWQFHQPSGSDNLVITASVVPGTDASIFIRTRIVPNANPTDLNDVGSILIVDGSESYWSAKFTVTYAGNYIAMGSTFAIMVVDAVTFET